jgi:seryl-tRNA(Sec) selenium transferase
MTSKHWSRREVLKQSGMISAAVAVAAMSPMDLLAQNATSKRPMPMPGHQTITREGDFYDNLFTRIGIRPMINCRGTFTIVSGSTSLMEVKQAMYDAAFYYVHLDEMMAAVGAEIGKLTGAEWGICTTGSAAATCMATVACIAGTDIEACEALPARKKKDQVLIPTKARNPYDIGVRMSGTELVMFDTAEEMKAKINERTAMLYLMAGPESTSGPLATSILAPIARAHGIPVFVDAAAEEPNRPNIHLTAGADLVAYSGGKCMRGPQSAGLLIGNKNLCQAAFYQAAPHHCYGRALKCSKEETMGVLAALRAWYTRDHAAETKKWTGWMEYIGQQLKGVPTLEYTVTPPHEDLSNKCPGLRVTWDHTKVGITGTELADQLYAGTPRILLPGRGTRQPSGNAGNDDLHAMLVQTSKSNAPITTQSGFSVTSYMLNEGDPEIIAAEVKKVLLNPGHHEAPVIPQGAAANIDGNWAVTIHYLRGTGEQHFTLKADGNKVTGEQKGEYFDSTFTGSIHANEIRLESVLPVISWPVHCHFQGTVEGNRMSGALVLGSGSNFEEYGHVTWDAVRV